MEVTKSQLVKQINRNVYYINVDGKSNEEICALVVNIMNSLEEEKKEKISLELPSVKHAQAVER